jgi:hypothetical protein
LKTETQIRYVDLIPCEMKICMTTNSIRFSFICVDRDFLNDHVILDSLAKKPMGYDLYENELFISEDNDVFEVIHIEETNVRMALDKDYLDTYETKNVAMLVNRSKTIPDADLNGIFVHSKSFDCFEDSIRQGYVSRLTIEELEILKRITPVDLITMKIGTAVYPYRRFNAAQKNTKYLLNVINKKNRRADFIAEMAGELHNFNFSEDVLKETFDILGMSYEPKLSKDSFIAVLESKFPSSLGKRPAAPNLKYL